MNKFQKFQIFDGHNDSIQSTYLNKRGKGITILEKSSKGHIDIYRAKQGGLIGGFFAIQVPPENIKERDQSFGFHIEENGYYIDLPAPLDQQYAENFVNNVLNFASEIELKDDRIKIIRKKKDLPIGFDAPISMLLHLEGAEAIKKDLSNLESFYNKGVRSIGLFWSRQNAFGSGVQYMYPSTPDIGEGLTAEGKNLIRTCNDMGIIVDLAHINQKGFWDAISVTKKPIVVTHTSVNKICASSRSLTDEQILAVGKSGGVIGILFEPMMINNFGLKLPQNMSLDDVFAFLVKTPLSKIIQHIDYIVKLIGIEHVAFGADMDGAIMPSELKDASDFQNIVKELFKHGFKSDEIEKICYKNWYRLISETIK